MATKKSAKPKRPAPPSVEKYLSGFPKEIQEIANLLRGLLKEHIPNVAEAVYLGWQLIGYRAEVDGQDAYVGFVAPKSNSVMLGFEWGALMKDPHHLLGGMSKQVRHIVFNATSEVNAEYLVPLIREGVRLALLPKETKLQILEGRQPVDE
jgi:hypothetical protein